MGSLFQYHRVADVSGKVKFKGIEKGVSVVDQVDSVTGFTTKVITEARAGDQKCSVMVVDEQNQPVNFPGRNVPVSYVLSVGAQLMVSEDEEIHAGDIIAKVHRETTKTKDITGGLPRVAELFEARRPKKAAIIAEMDGYVSFGEDMRGKQRVVVTSSEGEQKDYLIPKGKYIAVREGEYIRKGEALMDGPRDPHDILQISGEKALASYLVDEVQEVYRLQGVHINDKHIELIIRQMLRKMEITDSGDTHYIAKEQVDRFELEQVNDKIMGEGGRPAEFKPLLLGITKTSLNTKSWISAASFQETTRILTDAAVQSREDHLIGLKENVIMGRLIPAGTGYESYHGQSLGFNIDPVMEEDIELLSGGDASVEEDSAS